MLVGVISDTHGVLPTTVHDAFAGVTRIIHAGDICDESILDELSVIAPVTAVRGNCDSGLLAWRLPAVVELHADGQRIVVAHRQAELETAARCADIAVSGHTHRAHAVVRGGTLFVNPGTAGGELRGDRRRTVAVLDCAARLAKVRFIDL